MKLIAVCTGVVTPMRYRTVGGDLRTVASGISKAPVSSLENPVSIEVKRLGIVGDEQCELAVHGGVSKAVYMMPWQHHDFWKRQLVKEGKPGVLNWGDLGENLVVEGLSEDIVCLGDEFEIGTARFRVTEPREPCFKFAIKMGYAAAPKQMVQAGNCGWYLSVLTPGVIQAGSPIAYLPQGNTTTVLRRFRELTQKGQLNLL
ncbi:MAG: MOSC domain-containing protein [Limnobacter sp.]|nr:MOSC domain-containing protein [Limnobacter sp.]